MSRRYIYLISPNMITKDFFINLKKILQTGKIKFFQMRFKKYSLNK